MATNQGINIEAKVTGEKKVTDLARALDLVAKHAERTNKTRLDQAFKQMGPEIQKVNREMQRNIVLQQQSGKATRRMELGFQQAGYQFQDLVVQLQGGVNPFVAISQQGSQLASFFAGPWGASIGLAIAALGALGTTLMATSGLGKTLKEELGELEAMNELLEDFGETFGKKFIGNIEEVRTTFGDLVADIYQQQIREMQGTIGKEFKMGVGAGFAESAAGSDGLFEQIGVFTEAGREAAEELDRRTLEVQKILNKLSSEDIVSKDALANAFNNAYDELEKLGYVSEEYLKKLRNIAIEQGLDLEIIKNKGKAQEDVNDLLEDEKDLTEDLRKMRNDAANDQDKAQAKLLKEQGNLVQAEELEKDIAERILRIKAEQAAEGKALTTEQQKHLDAAIRSARAAIKLKYELDLAKDITQDMAKALAKSEAALSRMQGFGNSLSVALAKAKAEADALATGADVQSAKTIAGYREQLKQKVQDMRDAGVEDSIIRAEQASAGGKITELSKILTANAKERERQREAEKAGKKDASDQKKFDDYIASQQRELELKVKNFGLTEEIIKRNEYEFKIKEKAASLGVEATDKQMKAVMELYDKTAQLEQLQPYIDAFEDGLTNAFVAVVDGTQSVEDAFKGMLRTIILEIYKQEVASTAAKGISGFIKGLLQADGGVHSRGLVTPFAYGGVVGGPTMFPMRDGIGLMGEAGPEAIMPLKRGRDGKLGVEGGGGVTVVQNINISTGVQQTVRNEIRTLMPQIANSAKAAVSDAKRRGGSYGRALS